MMASRGHDASIQAREEKRVNRSAEEDRLLGDTQSANEIYAEESLRAVLMHALTLV